MKDDLRILQYLVDTALNRPKYTYQMDRNAPRPAGDYAAVRLHKTSKIGYDKVEYNGSGVGMTMKTKGIRILEFDVLFSRDDDCLMDMLNNAFHHPFLHHELGKKGYAWMDRYPINLRDRTFETDWEIRNGMTLVMNVIREYEYPVVGQIEGVELNGNYDEGTLEYPVKIIIGDNE